MVLLAFRFVADQSVYHMHVAKSRSIYQGSSLERTVSLHLRDAYTRF